MKISEKRLADYPWYVRLLLWLQRRKYGEVLRPGLLWGRSPRVFLAMAALYGAIDRRGSPLDPVLRSLVTVRVSQMNWCRFCVDINSATLAQRAGSFDKVQALVDWRGSPVFDERERVALEYAEAMTAAGVLIPDELFARLRRHFGDDAIVELTALIAFQNLSSKENPHAIIAETAQNARADGMRAMPCRMASSSPHTCTRYRRSHGSRSSPQSIRWQRRGQASAPITPAAGRCSAACAEARITRLAKGSR